MNNPPDAPSAASTINLKVITTLIIRKLWLIALCFFAVLAVAFAYVEIATPQFESLAVLQVEKEQQQLYKAADKEGANDAQTASDDTEIKTIEQDLQLDSLFERVVTNPAVVADKDFLPGLKISPDKSYTTHDLAAKLAKATTIKLRHNTRLIDVSVLHPDPATAQLLNTTLVNEFISQNGSSQTNTDKMAMTFLEGQAAKFKTDLQAAQDALQVYSASLLLKDRITDQRKEVDDLTQRYRAKHPKLIEAKSALSELDTQFDASINAAIASSPTEAAYWSASVKAVPGESFDDHVANELKFVEARTNVLQSEGDTQRALFDNVLKQMREADVSKETAPIAVDIVQPPSLPDPDKPAKPKKSLLLALAGVAGLIIGFGLVFVLDGLDSSLKTVDDAAQLLNLPVLGLMPVVKKLASKKAAAKDAKAVKGANLSGAFVSKGIVLVNDPDGLAAENFRSLRASIALLGKEKDHRVFLFSSAMTSEGKTFTSCNFAVSLAQQGLKTLLIDADLRCPAVYKQFNLSEKTMGLIEHVSLGVPLADVIQSNVVENLDILLPGVKCPSPAEFLSGDGLKDVLQECLLKYDRIVLDTAPINVVSDTLLIAPYVQSVCLVVRLGQTPRSAIQRALGLLEMTKVKPVGVVLNCVPIDWKAAGYSKPGQSMADHNYGRAYVKT